MAGRLGIVDPDITVTDLLPAETSPTVEGPETVQALARAWRLAVAGVSLTPTDQRRAADHLLDAAHLAHSSHPLPGGLEPPAVDDQPSPAIVLAAMSLMVGLTADQTVESSGPASRPGGRPGRLSAATVGAASLLASATAAMSNERLYFGDEERLVAQARAIVDAAETGPDATISLSRLKATSQRLRIGPADDPDASRLISNLRTYLADTMGIVDESSRPQEVLLADVVTDLFSRFDQLHEARTIAISSLESEDVSSGAIWAAVERAYRLFLGSSWSALGVADAETSERDLDGLADWRRSVKPKDVIDRLTLIARSLPSPQ